MLLSPDILSKPDMKQAWEKFVSTGEINSTLVHPVILRSWNNSKQAVVNPFESYSEESTPIEVMERLSEERNNLLEELYAANKQLKTVISTISEGILSINKEYIITHANSAIANLLGMLPSELIGKKFNELLGECEPVYDMIKTGRGFLEEEIVIESPLKQIRCMLKASPIKNECLQVVGAVITFREIKQVHHLVNKMVGAQAKYQFQDIIGNSDKIKQIIRKAKIAGNSTSTVLLLGESGTGKEVLAQAIHNSSKRKQGPYIAVNCAAMPRELIQSELFGYSDGAFTGARRGGRPGKFELADGGTLLLDEIGDMSLDLQVNLLRFLEEKNVMRIGGEKAIPVNVRVIAATNKDLRVAVEEGTFREDLYYRLNVITLHVPSLRERENDVYFYVEYFLKRMSLELGKEVITVDPLVMDIFNQYQWPGNIRELENVLEYAVNMTEGNILTKEFLPPYLLKKENKHFSTDNIVLSLEELECQEIKKAIKLFAGNMSRAAKALGIARNTLYEKIKKYQIHH